MKTFFQDTSLSIDETNEEILDEDAVLGVRIVVYLSW